MSISPRWHRGIAVLPCPACAGPHEHRHALPTRVTAARAAPSVHGNLHGCAPFRGDMLTTSGTGSCTGTAALTLPFFQHLEERRWNRCGVPMALVTRCAPGVRRDRQRPSRANADRHMPGLAPDLPALPASCRDLWYAPAVRSYGVDVPWSGGPGDLTKITSRFPGVLAGSGVGRPLREMRPADADCVFREGAAGRGEGHPAVAGAGAEDLFHVPGCGTRPRSTS